MSGQRKEGIDRGLFRYGLAEALGGKALTVYLHLLVESWRGDRKVIGNFNTDDSLIALGDRVRYRELCAACQTGRDQVRAALDRLEEVGWLQRVFPRRISRRKKDGKPVEREPDEVGYILGRRVPGKKRNKKGKPLLDDALSSDATLEQVEAAIRAEAKRLGLKNDLDLPRASRVAAARKVLENRSSAGPAPVSAGPEPVEAGPVTVGAGPVAFGAGPVGVVSTEENRLPKKKLKDEVEEKGEALSEEASERDAGNLRREAAPHDRAGGNDRSASSTDDRPTDPTPSSADPLPDLQALWSSLHQKHFGAPCLAWSAGEMLKVEELVERLGYEGTRDYLCFLFDAWSLPGGPRARWSKTAQRTPTITFAVARAGDYFDEAREYAKVMRDGAVVEREATSAQPSVEVDPVEVERARRVRAERVAQQRRLAPARQVAAVLVERTGRRHDWSEEQLNALADQIGRSESEFGSGLVSIEWWVRNQVPKDATPAWLLAHLLPTIEAGVRGSSKGGGAK